MKQAAKTTVRKVSSLRAADRVILAHAHPDDETLWTGALIADLLDAGVEVHVVTATRGELGELRPEVTAVANVEPGTDGYTRWREGELACALSRLGVTHHAWLGFPRVYRDSGMRWGSPGVAGPADASDARSLTAAPVADAAHDLGAYVQAVGGGVLVSYDRTGGYGHPDHVRMHEVTRHVARDLGHPMLEVVPPGKDVPGDPNAVDWIDLSRHQPTVAEALDCYRSQLAVEPDGEHIVHVGGAREPIVTLVGLRQVE